MNLKELILIKAEILKIIRAFLEQKGFIESFYPGITNATGSCESVGNVFTLKTKEFLTLSQTSQLSMEAELINSDLSRMYTLGLSFRKDRGGDGRHLNQFSLLEYEALNTDLNWLLKFNEELIEEIITKILHTNLLTSEQNKILYSYYSKGFKRLTYDEALDFLNMQGFKIIWGDDFNADIEACLTKEYGIVQVVCYPEPIKFFNMLNTRVDSGDLIGALDQIKKPTVQCVDMLLPKSGESIGGSAREHNYEILKRKLESSLMLRQLKELKEEHDSKPEEVMQAFETYLNLFKKRVIPRTGSGLGMGRLLQFILNSDTIINF